VPQLCATFDHFDLSLMTVVVLLTIHTDPQQAASTIAMQKASVSEVLIRRSPCTSTCAEKKSMKIKDHYMTVSAIHAIHINPNITQLSNQQINLSLTSFKYLKFYVYCGIIIVRGGSMFVDFMGHPYPQIYIPTKIHFLFFNLHKWYPNCSYLSVTHKLTSPQTIQILVTHQY
jgi:hypothetical protein